MYVNNNYNINILHNYNHNIDDENNIEYKVINKYYKYYKYYKKRLKNEIPWIYNKVRSTPQFLGTALNS